MKFTEWIFKELSSRSFECCVQCALYWTILKEGNEEKSTSEYDSASQNKVKQIVFHIFNHTCVKGNKTFTLLMFNLMFSDIVIERHRTFLDVFQRVIPPVINVSLLWSLLSRFLFFFCTFFHFCDRHILKLKFLNRLIPYSFTFLLFSYFSALLISEKDVMYLISYLMYDSGERHLNTIVFKYLLI